MSMIPRPFEYIRASTLSDAISFLEKHEGEAKVLAGGQSLIPLMKLRLASPSYVVDINRVPGLEYIEERDGYLAIGALTRHHAFEVSELVRRRYTILADAASVIGDPQVRNMGTIGGALAHCDPAGDWGPVMLALRAEAVVTGPRGQRLERADSLFVDLFTTSLAPAELITEIRVPAPKHRSGGAYMKLERKAGDFAVVGVAAQLSLDANGTCIEAGIGLTGVGKTYVRPVKAEEVLVGKKVTEDAIKEAARYAAEAVNPPSDIRASSSYRKAMVEVFTRRALRLALRRAGGGP
jgi:carbon-monoxide dehydrogenase medium subunit